MYFIQVILQSILEPGENRSGTMQWNLYQFRDGVFNPPRPGIYNIFGLCYPAGILTQSSIVITLVQWNRGDINYDLKVDILDIAIAASAFGSYPGHERWNPIADINNDNRIDIKDIGAIAKEFGKTV